MKHNFIIAIPSYKRADKLANTENTTLSYISNDLLAKTCLFVRDEEYEEYLEKVKPKYSSNLSIFNLGKINGHIPETRDKIIDACDKCEYLIMIDDDIRFAYRPNMDSYYVPQNKDIFENMIIEMLKNCFEEIPLVGIAPRQFSHNLKEPIKQNWRIIQVFCMHIPTIIKENIKFMDPKMDYMTDYYFTISLLQRGYKNRVLTRYTKDDIMQAHGGCSEYRTEKNTNESAIKLHKIFPEIVTPYVKEGGTWGKSHIGVRIKWKKAYKGT